jgi:hypothetical protein
VRWLILSLVVLWIAPPASAQLAIKCAAPQGWSYILDGASRWEEDGVSGGSVSLVQDDTGRWDVVYATDYNKFTARQDGAKIDVVTNEGISGSVVLVATYPLGVVETFHLHRNEKGDSKLVITAAKPAIGAPARSSLFVSQCAR